MYENNNRNETYQGGAGSGEDRLDRDLNYTEGAYSDSASSPYGRRQTGCYASDSGARSSDGRPDQSYIPSDSGYGRTKRGRYLLKRTAGIVAAGVLFGCVAGGVMTGVNRLSERYFAEKERAEVQTTSADESLPLAEAAIPAPVISVSTGNDVSAIVEKAMPSVVAINNKVVYTQEDWFFGRQQYEAPGSGSGIIAGENDEELLIVTNNHVVQDSSELSVNFIDNTNVKAAVKGTDSDSDLAVIAVRLSDIPEETRAKIQIADLGDSDEMKLGQGVIAIGNALGQGQSVTVGYVSALDKVVKIDNMDRTLLQVDAAINPGNSGGALLNMQGEVVGINAAKYSSTEVEGMGYAIPVSKVQDIINELMTKTTKIEVKEEEQGYLGIQLQNIDSRMARAYGMPEGIYIYKIVEGSAAAASDLRERDIITKFDGERVKTGDDLQRMLTYYEGGTEVTLTVQSLENGSYIEREVKITLGFKKDNVQ